jgi:hypothetical protein
MARPKLSDELKKEIAQLPHKEKDKLLFRLIAKDEALIEKLTFQLLEGGNTREERREELKDEIRRLLQQSDEYFYSPGYLLLDLRSISGMITKHVRTTRDKYGEIELNLFMLNYALKLMGEKIQPFDAYKSRTLNTYIVKRAMKLQSLLGKLHEDYRLDFEEDMKSLARFLRADPQLVAEAEVLGLEGL